jgi:hypothetical protein
MIGMDPNVPEDHVYNLKMAIDSLGKMIPSANQVRASFRLTCCLRRPLIYAQEAVVAGRLAAWVSQLDLANRLHFFTIFKGATPSPIMRISRSIAHRLLTRDAEYSALPPLEPLEELLRASDGPFAIAKETDFEAFYLHVQLASVALAGLEDYVAAEKRGAAPRLPSIGDALDRLHGRIRTCSTYPCDPPSADVRRGHAGGEHGPLAHEGRAAAPVDAVAPSAQRLPPRGRRRWGRQAAEDHGVAPGRPACMSSFFSCYRRCCCTMPCTFVRGSTLQLVH